MVSNVIRYAEWAALAFLVVVEAILPAAGCKAADPVFVMPCLGFLLACSAARLASMVWKRD